MVSQPHHKIQPDPKKKLNPSFHKLTLLNAIDAFKNHLVSIKEKPIFFPALSESSLSILAGWETAIGESGSGSKQRDRHSDKRCNVEKPIVNKTNVNRACIAGSDAPGPGDSDDSLSVTDQHRPNPDDNTRSDSEHSDVLPGKHGAAESDLFFSEGNRQSRLYFLDSSDRFFSGKSGDLLIKILGAMTLSPDDVFICNIEDMDTVVRVIQENRPEVIISLGSSAGKLLLDTDQPLEQFRGEFFEFHGIKVMPTFHPSLLIKDAQYKRAVWEDMKQVMSSLKLDSNA